MNPFDSYMLNKVRRLKDHRTRYAAMGEKTMMADVPDHMGTVPAAHSESRLRLRTRRLEKLRCTFAQMLRCRGWSRPQ